VKDLEWDMEAAGIRPPALFAIGPTVGHADRLNWYERLPLAGFRLMLTADRLSLARVLEERGADAVVMPTPVTPAARVAASALPVTGMVVCAAADVDWLHDERDAAGHDGALMAWCLGHDASERARERGWARIVELPPDLECDALASRIVESLGCSGKESR
jgi:uroporphyrinogen III methyltransferase/synthase